MKKHKFEEKTTTQKDFNVKMLSKGTGYPLQYRKPIVFIIENTDNRPQSYPVTIEVSHFKKPFNILQSGEYIGTADDTALISLVSNANNVAVTNPQGNNITNLVIPAGQSATIYVNPKDLMPEWCITIKVPDILPNSHYPDGDGGLAGLYTFDQNVFIDNNLQ